MDFLNQAHTQVHCSDRQNRLFPTSDSVDSVAFRSVPSSSDVFLTTGFRPGFRPGRRALNANCADHRQNGGQRALSARRPGHAWPAELDRSPGLFRPVSGLRRARVPRTRPAERHPGDHPHEPAGRRRRFAVRGNGLPQRQRIPEVGDRTE